MPSGGVLVINWKISVIMAMTAIGSTSCHRKPNEIRVSVEAISRMIRADVTRKNLNRRDLGICAGGIDGCRGAAEVRSGDVIKAQQKVIGGEIAEAKSGACGDRALCGILSIVMPQTQTAVLRKHLV